MLSEPAVRELADRLRSAAAVCDREGCAELAEELIAWAERLRALAAGEADRWSEYSEMWFG